MTNDLLAQIREAELAAIARVAAAQRLAQEKRRNADAEAAALIAQVEIEAKAEAEAQRQATVAQARLEAEAIRQAGQGQAEQLALNLSSRIEEASRLVVGFILPRPDPDGQRGAS